MGCTEGHTSSPLGCSATNITESNQRKQETNPSWRTYYKTTGLYSSTLSTSLKTKRRRLWLKKTKETWQLNAMHDSGLHSKCGGKKLHVEHYWSNWQNVNMDCTPDNILICWISWTWQLYGGYVREWSIQEGKGTRYLQWTLEWLRKYWERDVCLEKRGQVLQNANNQSSLGEPC